MGFAVVIKFLKIMIHQNAAHGGLSHHSWAAAHSCLWCTLLFSVRILCPFSSPQPGITCQWASKHSHPDPLTSEYLQQTPVAAAVTGLPVAPPLKTEDKNGVVTAEALAAALDGASAAVIPLLTPVDPTASQVEAARASAAATGFPEPSTPAEQDDVDGAAQAFWRGDGTIPMRPVALLPGPSIQSSINTMDKAVQNQLW